jgi:hypothetical protein
VLADHLKGKLSVFQTVSLIVSGKDNLFFTLGLDGKLVREFYFIPYSPTLAVSYSRNSRKNHEQTISDIPVNRENKSAVSENMKTTSCW